MFRYSWQRIPNTNILFIMIDYIKLLVLKIDINTLLNNKKLDFKTIVSESTGVISTKRIATFHYCKITVYDSGIVIFQGSIHKLFNSIKRIKAPNYNKENYKGFNGNDFTLDNILEVKNILCKLFNCEPQQMIFQNIEFGINCKLDINIDLFIKGLMYHKGIYFEHKFKRSYAEVKHQRYRIKIYNKGKQYKMQEPVIRLELSINKMEEIKDVKINSFNDINTKTLNSLNNVLLRRLDEVLHYDYTIKKKELSKSNNRLINQYSNSVYWLDILKPSERHRHKERLKRIIKNHSDNTFDNIKKEIVKKCSILNRLTKNKECSIINYSNIELNILHSYSTKCIVTGIDLSLEKGDAMYIRTKTLRYLKQYKKDTYLMLCSTLLNNTKGKLPIFEKDIIQHLAKQIRNRYYNKLEVKQIGYNKKIYPNQLSITFYIQHPRIDINKKGL
jgi:hypothetical protein